MIQGVLWMSASALLSLALTGLFSRRMRPDTAAAAFSGIALLPAAGMTCALALPVSAALQAPPRDSLPQSALWIGLLAALAFGAIGYADTMLRQRRGTYGFAFREMLALQTGVCAAYLLGLFFAYGKSPTAYFPFAGTVRLGVFFWLFGWIAVIGPVNAGRLTRTQSELYPAVCGVGALSILVLSLLRGAYGAGMLAAACIGCCLGSLVFLRRRELPLGETGRMLLGALTASAAFAAGAPVLLLFTHAVWIAELITFFVCARRSGGRESGRPPYLYLRLLENGKSERQVAGLYAGLTLICGAAGAALLYLF